MKKRLINVLAKELYRKWDEGRDSMFFIFECLRGILCFRKIEKEAIIDKEKWKEFEWRVGGEGRRSLLFIVEKLQIEFFLCSFLGVEYWLFASTYEKKCVTDIQRYFYSNEYERNFVYFISY